MNNSDRLRYANIKSLNELRVEKRILSHRIQEKEIRFEYVYDSIKAAVSKVSNLISSFVVSVTLIKTFWIDIQNTLANGSELLDRIKSVFSRKKKNKEESKSSSVSDSE